MEKDKKLLAILAYGKMSPDVIKNLSKYVINNLSPDVIKNLSPLKQLIDDLPVLEKPYSVLLEEIQAKKRIHNQSDWGPKECPPEQNICNTAMCTAGHLVNMAGAYKLKELVGWTNAASFVHQKSTSAHLPEQNYGSIPQEWAMAFIEENAKMENA